jgi:glutamine cyclotransferase
MMLELVRLLRDRVLLPCLLVSACVEGRLEREAVSPVAPPRSVAPTAAVAAVADAPVSMRARVLATYPHDPEAYTQGLIWHQGRLFESQGRYYFSGLRRLVLETGAVEIHRDVADELFAEGLERVGDELVQLTWQEGVALRYRLADLALIREQPYRSGEGWGLAFDGERLIASDGSHLLRFLDPSSLAEMDRVEVRRRGVLQGNLNELEYAQGALYANVYQTDQIVRIEPSTGRVTAVIDAAGLLSPREAMRAEVLNGIAYRPETDTFLITGKLWPKLFEVRFEEITD